MPGESSGHLRPYPGDLRHRKCSLLVRKGDRVRGEELSSHHGALHGSAPFDLRR